MLAATLHLIAGSTGAGKTTYAWELARREKALRFSIDEWMVTLFAPDQPATVQFEWMMERIRRCEAQMWAILVQAAELGQSVVIDCGLTRQAHRGEWTERARSAGLAVCLHHLDIDADERWRRVERRNAERGPTYRFHVSREMFDFVERMWEPPTTAELGQLNGVRIAGHDEIAEQP